MKQQSRTRACAACLMLGAAVVLWSAQAAEAQRPRVPRMRARITAPQPRSTAASPVDFIATVENGTPPFTYTWRFPRGTPASITTQSSLAQNLVSAAFSPGRLVSAAVTVTDSRAPRPVRSSARVVFRTAAAPPRALPSINSTSANGAGPAPISVPEQPIAGLPDFQVVAANDLGMHCGDLDHRVASILPPFNVLHAQVIQKGTAQALPRILGDADVSVDYSAASQARDPALQVPFPRTLFKTNFWDPNPRPTGNLLVFDAYDPFYPPGILDLFPLATDIGLPVPDLAASPPSIEQQNMPGVLNPFGTNAPQPFRRFDVSLPFFSGFPFGYDLVDLNWFAADGIPIAPFDDAGRKNPYPLLRVQPRAAAGNTLGVTAGATLATVDAVAPVSAEADCFRCHTSSADGGNGEAACIPGADVGCAAEGSRRGPEANRRFDVVTASEAPLSGALPLEVSREWAADMNIVRLHDAKHFEAQGRVTLASTTPVVCQRCHYTPALDLLQAGPADTPNGRQQTTHQTNSRVLHSFHARFTDLFPNDMPPPNDPGRMNAVTGKPVINALVQGKLNQSCYQCHPGRVTQCLRGAMFNGGLVCQDCHGSLQQVGDDFSRDLPTTGQFDLTKRVPWASEPKCQSCHTGDAFSNLGQTDPNVIRAADNIRLLQAYRVGDAAATPIAATNRRFAENVDRLTGNHILYRLSKDAHAGLFCESCHGSTHAEWPVLPSSGAFIANDNMAALQLQGHVGPIAECTTCHTAGTVPLGLGGPHGLHAVGDDRWVSVEGPGHHSNLAEATPNECRACHGVNGEGTVLARVTAARSFRVEGRVVSLATGRQVSCAICHDNPLRR